LRRAWQYRCCWPGWCLAPLLHSLNLRVSNNGHSCRSLSLTLLPESRLLPDCCTRWTLLHPPAAVRKLPHGVRSPSVLYACFPRTARRSPACHTLALSVQRAC
jgi:hypothetical protein